MWKAGRVNGRSILSGALASGALSLFYVAVVAGASGSWAHLGEQTRKDWYYLLIILTGFGVQVTLIAELRRRHALRPEVAAAGGSGAGASGLGMVACCAHHLVDLAPLAGASGAAVFLTDYRTPIMVLGITVNAVGVALAARQLGHTPLHADSGSRTAGEEVDACAAA